VPGIDSKTLAVARYLAKCAANKEDGHCWPSVRTIRKATRYSQPSVQRAIRALELAGELYVDRGGPNEGSSHYYLLDLDEPERQEAIAEAKQAAEDRRAQLKRQKAAATKRQPKVTPTEHAARRRGRAVAAGQLELPVAEPGDQVVSDGRLVTPPRWKNRHHPGGIRGGVPQIPGGVRQTPRSSKGSSHPPNPQVAEQEGDYRARRAAALRRLTEGAAG
jgi:DNA-binding MarR family transcriptional regulator